MAAPKNILVTGGAGFIGSHTVVELINSGYQPVIVDDFRNSHRHIIDGINSITGKESIVRQLDLCNREALKNVFEEFNFDGIIHFAAYKAVGESVEKPLAYYRNNTLSLLNCLELAVEFNVKNVVFSSSCTVYGEPKGSQIVTEQSPIQKANSPYGNTKQIGEEILQDLVASGADIKVLNLRYFNPVGAHPSSLIGELPLGRPNNLLPVVTQTAIGKLDKLTVYGNDYNTKDGTCLRDYIHVTDVASAHVSGMNWLMKQTSSVIENVNIGTGKAASVLEIIHTFEKVANHSLIWELGPRREGDVEQIYADVAKAEQLLGWKAEKTVEDAIRDAWNWELKLNDG